MPCLQKLAGHTVIIADGKFPENRQVINALRSANTIVCCDGAADRLVNFGLLPTYIAGDLDSISSELKARFTDRLYYSPDQESNDLTKAVELCREKGLNDLYIIGATGLREDHTLANISLLTDYAEHVKVAMLTDYGVFSPILATSDFESRKGQQVSIFSLTPSSPIVLHGLKYPVNNRPFTSWWQGSLNESLGDMFRIEFTEGKLVVFRQY
ncbi:MAG: thiamine diphosphokinase [Prevotellaceae bacterium]|nr:thiamine diphosphokinase [Prevotellaceae bacterium]